METSKLSKMICRMILCVVLAPGLVFGAAKPRVIATTDGEGDDRCSMVRFLMYANEWDIKGMIYSSSVFHWKGDGKTQRHTWRRETWIEEDIDKYAEVYANLKKHDPGYPAPEYLRKQIFVGNIALTGDMRKATPGSDRIVEVLLDSDPSPVWLQAWGGSNTIARALKTIEEKYPDRMAEVSRKARLYLITLQDKTYRDYISKQWPQVQTLISGAFGAIAYSWKKHIPEELHKYFDDNWMKTNIKGHGALSTMHPGLQNDRSMFISEGDSPSFMHEINVGLGSMENPEYGGWGGRFVREKGHEWRDAQDDTDKYKTIYRWAIAFQNDWAARADWCVKPYSECNHAPTVVCNADSTQNVLDISVDPGDEIELCAAGSSDPDGDTLSYRWWVYKDAGNYWAETPIRGAEAADAVITVPDNASGRTIHVILEVTDDGKPPLTRYRRLILKVSGKPLKAPPDTGTDTVYLRTPITKLSGPAAKTGKWWFYRGINLNGPTVEIDGNQWQDDNAPNFACKNSALNRPDIMLRPPTDDTRARMIHSFRWSGRPKITLTHVPAGMYAIYAYVWEDNDPETLSISLQGRVVARNHISGVKGQWHRLGPWTTIVTDGAIEITSAGGAANFSGIEVWRSIGARSKPGQ